MKKYLYIPFSFILLCIILNIIFSIYIIPNRRIDTDQAQHFYDMKKWIELNKIPTTSARFESSRVIADEEVTGRVPGGAYYISYILCYKLANNNLINARFINYFFNMIIVFIFLFWFYKKFGILSTSIITPIILFNGYFILSTTDFWNPNISLIFSFIFFILLFEYIQNISEVKTKISATFIFPIVAIMAQGHFFTFFSIVPTLIIYLIFKYKNTLKYIKYWLLGVFISFLEYLPYIISEINTNFSNLHKIFATKNNFSSFPFPQLHALLIYPTNEMSVFFSTRFEGILNFIKNNPFSLYCLPFLFISLLFSLYCFISSFSILKKKNEDYSIDMTLRDMLLIFIIYIPVSIVCTMLFVSKVGAFHYFYSFYSISFVPIIIFIYKHINKNKVYMVMFPILILNIVAMILQIKFYVDSYEIPASLYNMGKVINSIYDDSKGNDINIHSVRGVRNIDYIDYSKIFYPTNSLTYKEDSTNIYYIINVPRALNLDIVNTLNNISNFNINHKLIFSNKIFLVYKSN